MIKMNDLLSQTKHKMRLVIISLIFLVNIYNCSNDLNRINIYADYIDKSVLYLYTYDLTGNNKLEIVNTNNNLPIDTQNITNTKQNSTSDNNEIIYLTLDNQILDKCGNYKEEKISVRNCTFNILNNNNKVTEFSLINLNYTETNITQSFIDFTYNNTSDDNLYIFPQFLQSEKSIDFIECNYTNCGGNPNTTIVEPLYDQYNFNLDVNESIKSSYNLVLHRAFLIVRNDISMNKLFYFRDITHILLDGKDFKYKLTLNNFPELFDLYLVYNVNSLPAASADNNVKFLFNI